jgi:uncharacterized protein (TIGR02246 family)
MRRQTWLGFAFAVAIAPTGALADNAADVQAIRDLHAKWLTYIAAGDAAAIAGLFAPKAQMFTPNSPALAGREQIQQIWTQLMATPGFDLKFEPTTIHVAEAGDLAYEVGSYSLAFSGEQGAINDRGNYIDVWQKIGGEWLIVQDFVVSSQPMPMMQ